jgi:MFS family permease
MSEVSSGAIVDPAKYRGKVLAAAIAGYAFDGFDIMVLALTIPVLLGEWAGQGFNLVQVGVVATAMLIGMSLGGYVFGPIADKFGRKKGLIWCIAFFGITTGLTFFAQNYIQLAALRFLAGLGLGAEYALGGTMVAEFFPPEKRGKLSSWVQMGWPLGFGVAVVAQYFMMPIWGWRSLYLLGTSAVLVAIYIQIFVPESPVWLKAQENKKKGIVVAGPPAAKLTDLFKGANMRAFLTVTLFFTSMLITYWAVNTWLPTVLARERGMSPKQYSGFLMVMQFMAVIAYFAAGIVADKFGKRRTMAVCAFLSALTLALWLGMEWEDDRIFWVLGAIAWAVASGVWALAIGLTVEQFPTNVRAVGFASAYSTGRLLTTLVPLVMGAVAVKIGLTQVMAAVSIFYFIAMIAILLMKESKAQL